MSANKDPSNYEANDRAPRLHNLYGKYDHFNIRSQITIDLQTYGKRTHVVVVVNELISMATNDLLSFYRPVQPKCS